uniref:AA_permease_C domain-containing protein n=1 Tax=Macrostomum lignano TaxID=282301 RepID=A0A1I8JNC9_9PLAT
MAGHLVSKTNTRLGKTRPWMMIANPIGCAMFFILWIVLFPVTEDYNGAKFAYYLVVYLLYCTLITCYHVPYTHVVDNANCSTVV